MCRYNSAISVYKCGAVEHVERKEEDCKRRHCINSTKHPMNCVGKPFALRLKDFILNGTLRSPEHGPGCQNYHYTTYTFANLPSEQCSDKSCQVTQEQDDEKFTEAIKIFHEDVVLKMSEMEKAEQDAASTRQLRDEPM